jgi:hypothetical protein
MNHILILSRASSALSRLTLFVAAAIAAAANLGLKILGITFHVLVFH